MKVLFIAPLPPPITGHSLASQVFLESLSGAHQVAVVNLSVGSRNDGSVTGRRLFEVAKVLRQIRREQGGADAIYLTISESLAGNLKDLAIYMLCASDLSRMYLHLHGGSIRRLLFDRSHWLRRMNSAFIPRMGGVIVSGRSHQTIFDQMVGPEGVHVVPNFAQDHLFVEQGAVRAKFAYRSPLRILYLSGMTAAKGYAELASAYLSLDEEARARIRIDFAGKFDFESDRRAFLARIEGVPGIRYHGLVDESQKQALFAQAHVFCLPTTLLEGQPISILEAYASGCAVVTTGQPGIRDVFADQVNGFELATGSSVSIGRVLAELARETSGLGEIAARNRATAEAQYRTRKYSEMLTRILEGRGSVRVMAKS